MTGHAPDRTATARVHSGALAAPLSTPSRVDDIESRLVSAVAIGEYLPGSRLPSERDLAASLGVGRDTVRLALGRLVERGVLETQRGRGGGSFVRTEFPESSASAVRESLAAQWDSLRDTMTAISRIHGAVAEAAADSRVDADIALLRELLENYRTAASGVESQRADAALHVAIIDATHNTALRDVLFQLESRISIGAPTHIWGDTDSMRERELRAAIDHAGLVEAICDGDAPTAGTIARRHVLIDIEIIEHVLR